MRHSSIPSAQLVVQHCKAKKIKNIIISPGSRNAPLTISFTEDSYFKCFSVVDERCAAFFGMGIAQQLNEPVVVVCTSGSALLNYYPAVAEAFYSHIPLIVLSADRPTYLIDVGDGQAIRQENVFGTNIGYSANLKQDISHAVDSIKSYRPQWLQADKENQQKEIQKYNEGELIKALNTAINDKDPVHINVPFEEPLYDFISEPTVEVSLAVENVIAKELTFNLAKFSSLWNKSKKKMILVGVNGPNSVEQELLNKLTQDPSVLVFTESTANLYHQDYFSSIDSIIAPLEKAKNKEELFELLRPDILMTFGGLIISKKIKAFLRKYKPKQHWHIGEGKVDDTFFSLTQHFKTTINLFLVAFLKETKNKESRYFEYWNKVKNNYKTRRKEYMEQIPFSDLLAFHYITTSIPKNYQLQLANSSTVRYMQLLEIPSTVSVFCNRGTSGIDGNTSTAIGASIYCLNPTILITGDLSFFYDSNALWNKYLRPDFRIIVINNQGGGIFRILPGQEKSSNFENYFETVHNLDAKHLCKMYGISYQVATDADNLRQSFSSFYKSSNNPKLLEIKTSRILNDKILIGYFDFIS